jgi:hypothetical protein
MDECRYHETNWASANGEKVTYMKTLVKKNSTTESISISNNSECLETNLQNRTNNKSLQVNYNVLEVTPESGKTTSIPSFNHPNTTSLPRIPQLASNIRNTYSLPLHTALPLTQMTLPYKPEIQSLVYKLKESEFQRNTQRDFPSLFSNSSCPNILNSLDSPLSSQNNLQNNLNNVTSNNTSNHNLIYSNVLDTNNEKNNSSTVRSVNLDASVNSSNSINSNYSWNQTSRGNDTTNINMMNCPTGVKSNTYPSLYNKLDIKDDETINFHEGFQPMMYKFARINNFGPLAWSSMILKDPLVRPIRDEVLQNKKKEMLAAPTGKIDSQHKNRFLKYLGVDDIKPIKIEPEVKDEELLSNNKTGRIPISENANIPFRTDGSSENHAVHAIPCINERLVLQQILKVLPNRKVVWLSVKRFFERVYPILPYLDQSSFIYDVEKLIGGNHFKDLENAEKIQHIYITKRLDFAILGTLLLVLKLSEESLIIDEEIEDDSIVRTPNELYLLKHPNDSNIINVAQLCLNQFSLLRKCALPIFQFALLMKEYENLNGLADGTNADSQIFISLLIQMGITIGLNRDPSKFEIIVSKGKLGNLWRKIWFRLIAMDTKQYILFGTSKTVNPEFSDTQLPTFDEESSNIDNYDLERIVIEKIKLHHKFDLIMIDLADYLCTFKTEPNSKVLLDKVLNLENMIRDTFGSVNDILDKKSAIPNLNVDKIWDFSIFCQAVGILVCIYQNMFVYYQKIKNFQAAKFFKEKGLFQWLYLFTNFRAHSVNCYKYFGVGYDMIITEILLPVIHKGWITLLSTYVSATLMIEKNGGELNNSKKNLLLKKICKQIADSGSYYLPCLKRLSKRHFNSWKLLKVHTYIVQLIRSKKFIFKSLLHLYNFMENMTEEDLLSLSDLINYDNYKLGQNGTALFKVTKNRLIKNEVTTKMPTNADFNNNNNTDVNDVNHANNVTNTTFIKNNNNINNFQSPFGGSSINGGSFNIPSAPFGEVELDGEYSIEAWREPMEEDMFWRDMFLQKQSFNEQTPSFGDTALSGLNTPTSQNGITSSFLDLTTNHDSGHKEYIDGVQSNMGRPGEQANYFVDQTIYNMFN